MLTQSNVKTNLAKQEQIIEAWKKENGWQSSNLPPKTGLEVQDKSSLNNHFFNNNAEKAKVTQKRQEAYKKQLKQTDVDKPKKAYNPPLSQDELQVKYKAQRAGSIDPDYYYYMFNGKYARQRHKPCNKLDDVEINEHPKFEGVYEFPQGRNWADRILNLLETYGFIDVDKFLEQHQNVHRYSLLPEARKLELQGKVKLVHSIRHGQPVKFVERVA